MKTNNISYDEITEDYINSIIDKRNESLGRINNSKSPLTRFERKILVDINYYNSDNKDYAVILDKAYLCKNNVFYIYVYDNYNDEYTLLSECNYFNDIHNKKIIGYIYNKEKSKKLKEFIKNNLDK